MNWTFLYVLAGVGLNLLIFGFWKPWAKGYAEEKGKTLARKEDLDAILAEVRAVTITQKEIESKLSGDLWNRQMHWNQKRDLYAQLLQATEAMLDALAGIPKILELIETTEFQQVQVTLHEQFNQRLQSFTNAQSDLSTATTLALIFGSDECIKLLQLYIRAFQLPGEQITAEWVQQTVKKLAILSTAIAHAAKNDIGLKAQ